MNRPDAGAVFLAVFLALLVILTTVGLNLISQGS